MKDLMSSLRSLVDCVPLRPLLYAAGAAATAAGLYYYLKKRGERSKEDCALLYVDEVNNTQHDSAVLEDLFSIAEEKTFKDKMASVLMKCPSLQDRVRTLEKLYSEAEKDSENQTKELKLACKANDILKSELNQMKEIIQSKESLEVTLAESKLKYEKAMMTSDEIAENIFYLKSESDILQDILDDQGKELPIACRRSEELLEVKCVLMSEYVELKESLQHTEKKKQQNTEVTFPEAKRKYEQAVLSNAGLRKENFKLISDSDHLQDILQEYKESLQLKCDDLIMECESDEEENAESNLMLQKQKN